VGNLLTTGSVLAAFFAGGVALFAPCCIVFLAPSYLAVAVKNRRWRLLPLTFMFAAVLALVLVPITLGMSLIAATIANYHAPLYYAGVLKIPDLFGPLGNGIHGQILAGSLASFVSAYLAVRFLVRWFHTRTRSRSRSIAQSRVATRWSG
jgi:hypothetical protein